MVDKLRQFADKMILIKRHESARLDKKSTDILQKTKKRQWKGATPISQGKTSAPTAKWETKSDIHTQNELRWNLRQRVGWQHKNSMC